jgi:single-strand DNA-binding protein
MINRIIIMGRLTADPELRTTNSGVSCCPFTVAVDRRVQSNGEKQADFIPCVAWRGTAEFVSKHFRKGKMIAVDGEMQTRKYTDKDGNNRTAFEVMAANVSFCGDGSGSGNNAAAQTQSEPTPSVPTQAADDFDPVDAYDDLPF